MSELWDRLGLFDMWQPEPSSDEATKPEPCPDPIPPAPVLATEENTGARSVDDLIANGTLARDLTRDQRLRFWADRGGAWSREWISEENAVRAHGHLAAPSEVLAFANSVPGIEVRFPDTASALRAGIGTKRLLDEHVSFQTILVPGSLGGGVVESTTRDFVPALARRLSASTEAITLPHWAIGWRTLPDRTTLPLVTEVVAGLDGRIHEITGRATIGTEPLTEAQRIGLLETGSTPTNIPFFGQFAAA